MKIKRYLAFAGRRHYPVGGWNDFINSYDTVIEATKTITDLMNDKEDPFDWGHVLDTHTGEVIWREGE